VPAPITGETTANDDRPIVLDVNSPSVNDGTDEQGVIAGDAGPLPDPAQDGSDGRVADSTEVSGSGNAATGTATGTGRYAATLRALESELDGLYRQPTEQQDFSQIRTRFEEIAQQKEEPIPAAIAEVRLRQIGDRQKLKDLQVDVLRNMQKIKTIRATGVADREALKDFKPGPSTEKFDLMGVLRPSLAFAPERRRYRLIDPSRDKTIAYVDIPAEVLTQVSPLIGRYVGVQAASKAFNPSAQITVVVASKVVDLTDNSRETPPANPRGEIQGVQSPASANQPVATAGEKAGE
jgi:hypothetical protein